jgi:hypothetical protein
MKLPWPRIVIITGVALLLAYAGDYVSLVSQIPRGRQQFDSVEVQKLLAVPQKDHKTEYIAVPPQMEQCVRSVFPHFGLTPCWYLARHASQQVNY